MAGRIPTSFIDELLNRVDIVDVVDRRVKLKRSGKNYMACCPFHEEKTPSFSVNQEKQFYYCFGCGVGGNAIGFLMEYERQGFPEAVETLATSCGLEVPREAGQQPTAAPPDKGLYTQLEQVASYFRDQLRTHPQRERAVQYLKKRGLSGEIARDFEIGFAPPGWDNLLRQLGDSDAARQRLIDSGMLVQREEDNKLYDRFRDRIMFPIRDDRGRVIAFGGRVLGDDKPKYLNSPETPIFNKGRELYGFYQARKNAHPLRRLLVVEGYMDVVALVQHGVPWCAATLGTATSTEHLKRIFRACPEVVFCFDGDAAGRQAALRALDSSLPAMEDGRRARFLFLPEGEDPDTLVRKLGQRDFEHLVDQAIPLENYLFDSQVDRAQQESSEGRALLKQRVAPLLTKLPEGVFKELMWDELAKRCGIARQRLVELLGAATASAAAAAVTPTNRAPDSPRALPTRTETSNPMASIRRNPVLYAITLLLLQPQAARDLPLSAELLALDDEHADLLRALISLLQRRPESTSAMLVGHWHGEPWGDVLKTLLQLDRFVPEDGIGQELQDTVGLLEKRQRELSHQREVDKLTAVNYAELSAEQKSRLKEILGHSRS